MAAFNSIVAGDQWTPERAREMLRIGEAWERQNPNWRPSPRVDEPLPMGPPQELNPWVGRPSIQGPGLPTAGSPQRGLDQFAQMTEAQRRAAYADAQQRMAQNPSEVQPLGPTGIQGPGLQPGPTGGYADGNTGWGAGIGPVTASQVRAGGGSQSPRDFFYGLFPGGTVSPEQLAAQEQALAAQGIRLMGPNAKGQRTKIELPSGEVIDVIGGAGAGHNRLQWLSQGMKGSGGSNPMQAIGQVGGSLGGILNGGTDYAKRLPALEKTPGYQFRFDQGMKALNGSAASKGNLLTGGAAKDAMEFGQGLASTEFDNEYRRLFGLAGLGQGAAGTIGQYGSSYGTNATNLLTGQGNAQAAGTVAGANAWNNFLGNTGQSAMDAVIYDQYRRRQPGPTGTLPGLGPNDYS